MNDKQYKKYLDDLYNSGKQRNIPNISPQNAQFILDIINQRNVKTMLEVGCANGYSGLHWAFYLKRKHGKDGMLHIIDVSEPMFKEAMTHLSTCKLHLNVCGYLGDGLKILPMFAHNLFDAIFIDAQKKHTKSFFELCLPLLKPNGIIIIDDVIKFADKMEGLIEYFNENNLDYKIVKTDEDDGILIFEKN
jgi:predicted O-methyltransferase YrrM